MSDFAEGAEFCAPFPFVRTTYEALPDDADGAPAERATWRPGTNSEFSPPDDFIEVADGIGSVLYSIVAVFKPGRYPTRVFFTRQWRDPDGKTFGKAKLRVTTQQAFRNLIAGWRHEYEIKESDNDATRLGTCRSLGRLRRDAQEAAQAHDRTRHDAAHQGSGAVPR